MRHALQVIAASGIAVLANRPLNVIVDDQLIRLADPPEFLLQPILRAPDLAQIFMTVGLSVILMNVALFLFTADFRSVKASRTRTAPITASLPRGSTRTASMARASATA